MSKVKPEKMALWLERLHALKPCAEAWRWAQQFDDPQELWDKCDNHAWMLWLIQRALNDHKLIVQLACRFARLALPHAKSPTALTCIETTEAWLIGAATIEQVREARRAATYAAAYADAAAYAAAAAAADATYAAATYAAANAADATYAAATYAAANAADANAADADAYAANVRVKTLAQCRDIIREVVKEVPLGQ